MSDYVSREDHEDRVAQINAHRMDLQDRIEAQAAEIERLWGQAVKLWALLDDIDTLDDACRNNHEQFRHLTREAQQRRHKILSSDEWDNARAALGGGDE